MCLCDVCVYIYFFFSGGLSILESDRRLVSAEVWNKLRVYFPKAPEFTQQHEPCQHCTVTVTRKINTWWLCQWCIQDDPVMVRRFSFFFFSEAGKRGKRERGFEQNDGQWAEDLSTKPLPGKKPTHAAEMATGTTMFKKYNICLAFYIILRERAWYWHRGG